MVDKKNFGFAELEQWFNERRVTEIECLVPDLTGVARQDPAAREIHRGPRHAYRRRSSRSA